MFNEQNTRPLTATEAEALQATGNVPGVDLALVAGLGWRALTVPSPAEERVAASRAASTFARLQVTI